MNSFARSRPKSRRCELAKLCAAAVLFHSAAVGCSPKQGYPGPQLPDVQTAHVFFSPERVDAERGISISSIKVDGEELGMFDAGIRLLPGKHKAVFEYQYRWTWCDRSVDDYCVPESSYGSCSFSFEVQGGRSYRAEVRGSRRGVGLFLIDEALRQPVAVQHCEAQQFFDLRF